RANPGVTSVVLLYGGHLAVGSPASAPRSWGSNNGASKYPGGSLSIRQTGSSRNNGIQTNAIAPLPAAAFTIAKTATPSIAGPGDQITYKVTVTNTGGTTGTATFTDDYDNGLTNVSTPAGCTNNSPSAGQMTCTTTPALAPNSSQTFTYTANLPTAFSGATGVSPCAAGQYKVSNTATFATGTNVTTGTGPASASVCVNAASSFSITKTPRSTTAAAGTNVTYDVVVTNTGSAPGATSFTDNYNDAASTVTLPTNCTDATSGTDKKFTCTTGTINPGQTETVTYTMKMPTSFTGPPTVTCTNGGYAVVNQVTVTGGASTTGTVCVTASPHFTITKTAGSLTSAVNGIVTYTVTVSNDGSGPGTATFTDNYNDNATAVIPLASGCVDSTLGTDKKFTCTTGTINPGAQQVFTYDIKMPPSFTGTPSGCANGGFPVTNTATLASGGTPASATVCVDASPTFTLKKTPRTTTAAAGANVTYDVVVTNNGSAPGSTTFTDNYNDAASTVTLPTSCTDSTSGTDKKFTCTTGTINPGQTETITYTLKMPTTFTGTPSGCTNGGYPVVNTVAVTGSSSDSATVCVAAAPQMGIVKTGTVAFDNNGDQIISYTISYSNTGPAEANAVTITDQLPAGTAFDSCTGGCTTAGSPTTVTWAVAPVAPLTGTGSVQLKVKVTTNQACSISNVAQVNLGGVPAATSAASVVNVTPVPDPSTAKSNGSAIGVQVKTKGLLQLAVGLLNAVVTGSGNSQVLLIGQTSSSQTGLGGPTTNEAHLLNLNLTGIINTGIIRETSASVVTAAPAETRQTSTSEVASVCLVPVAGICTVKSDTVRAVASTMANGSFSGVSAAGSTIENLYVAGIAVPVDLSQTTKIPLSAALFGKDSYVAINERTSSAGLVNGKYTADLTVSMIHVKITNLALIGALDVVVAQASAHSEFGKTLVCGSTAPNRSVSGHAYTAKLYTGPLLADLLLGYVQIAPSGGAESEHVAGVVIPSTGVAVNAQAADSSAAGSYTSTASTSRSWAEVAGDATKPACVLSYVTDCVVKATLIRSEARSNADSGGSTSTDTGTSLVGLRVLGIPIAATPDPNTTIALPGIGFIILNEQFCDNGAAVSHTCSAAGHTGITVRAVRVVVTVANNLLHLTPGVELIVAEAHADTTFGGLT
ncbi:MAG: choice-of-anchor P family protein, partial [Marmoricola sp.]